MWTTFQIMEILVNVSLRFFSKGLLTVIVPLPSLPTLPVTEMLPNRGREMLPLPRKTHWLKIHIVKWLTDETHYRALELLDLILFKYVLITLFYFICLMCYDLKGMTHLKLAYWKTIFEEMLWLTIICAFTVFLCVFIIWTSELRVWLYISNCWVTWNCIKCCWLSIEGTAVGKRFWCGREEGWTADYRLPCFSAELDQP